MSNPTDTPVTPADAARLLELASKAAALPWSVEPNIFGAVTWDGTLRDAMRNPVASVIGAGWDKRTMTANFAYIAAAANLAPALARDAARLAGEVADLRRLCGEAWRKKPSPMEWLHNSECPWVFDRLNNKTVTECTCGATSLAARLRAAARPEAG